MDVIDDKKMNLVNYNLKKYMDENQDYNKYLIFLLHTIEEDEDKGKYLSNLVEAIKLGPQDNDEEIKAKSELLCMIDYGNILTLNDIQEIYKGYGEEHNYIDGDAERNYSFEDLRKNKYYIEFKNKKGYKDDVKIKYDGGNRHNKPKSKAKPKSKPKPKAKPDDMNMKEVKDLCKANQIKLSKVVNEKRVRFTKKELLTKLKRKKLI
jgi:hypothetical protein